VHLLTTSNAKTLRGQGAGYLTMILHLAPARLSGYQVCPMATKGCAASCLNTSGRGRFARTQAARVRRTRLFFEDRATFMAQLVDDIRAGVRKARREGLEPVVRLNGTSDIRFETIPLELEGARYPNIMSAFPELTFYDYTKLPNRRDLPPNYRLTFSRSSQGPDQVREILRQGRNVAAVFRIGKRQELPQFWDGLPVIDGDRDDLRFLDPAGVVVGLRAKGQAIKDRSGFVLEPTGAP